MTSIGIWITNATNCMWGYQPAKEFLKHAAGGCAALGVWACGPRIGKSACIFDYHRVSDLGHIRCSADPWNVTPECFERQARWLAEHTECVPVEQLLDRLRHGATAKPLVALSFDDGFANFRHTALPVLRRYGLPATLAIATRYVGWDSPFPFDRWGHQVRSRAESMTWRPISWAEIEECVASGLVTVSSHSHSHFAACDCTEGELIEEACVSRELIQKYLGPGQGRFFCYPYGCSRLGLVPPAYVCAVRSAGYEMALTTDLGLVLNHTSRFLLPRIEAHGLDSPAILRGKANGYLMAFQCLQTLRKPRHFDNGDLWNRLMTDEAGSGGAGGRRQHDGLSATDCRPSCG